MPRNRNTNRDGGPFDPETIERVWSKAKDLPGYTIFKVDPCGTEIRRDCYGKEEKYGWEIDHIKPVAADGTDDIRTYFKTSNIL